MEENKLSSEIALYISGRLKQQAIEIFQAIEKMTKESEDPPMMSVPNNPNLFDESIIVNDFVAIPEYYKIKEKYIGNLINEYVDLDKDALGQGEVK